MLNYTITPRLYAIGKALLGENTDNSPIGIHDQHVILSNATLPELVAAKVLIEHYHTTEVMALLLVDCYLSAKTRNSKAA